jgi:DNA-binding transcriptional ArsR family regulator
MNVLKTAGLVTDRRDAQWVRYRRTPDLPPEVVALVEAALALAPASASSPPSISPKGSSHEHQSCL